MYPTNKNKHVVIQQDCKLTLIKMLEKHPKKKKVQLTFLDPPFNQGKDYKKHNDLMDEDEYWEWMTEICKFSYQLSEDGASIYFMQREKNAKYVLKALEDSGWTYQSLIIWKKITSAVPQKYRFGKQYQIIVYATKGNRPRTFNRLRIDLPIEPHHKYERENGLYVTDIWSDIRELTSGFFAGEEAIRDDNNERLHKQQSPVALLARIILSSTRVNDIVLDPFAGSGTTAIVCKQLKRKSLNIEIDPRNIEIVKSRLENNLPGDSITKLVYYYRFTENLENIWPKSTKIMKTKELEIDRISSIEDFID